MLISQKKFSKEISDYKLHTSICTFVIYCKGQYLQNHDIQNLSQWSKNDL